jgi:aspartate carbamoyltransferase catalytic subunit
MSEAMPLGDIVYMTRIQRERFSDPMEYEKVKNSYILNKKMLENTKANLKILHPLPRVNEIETEVDDCEQAYYFQQALNGVYVRQALLKLILGL